MKIQDLATLSGADKLRLALGLDEDQTSKIQTLVKSMAGSNPHIKDTYVGKAMPGTSFYDFKRNRLGIGHKSADVLAHEMGHAASLANSSEFYKSLLRASKRASRISNNISLPIAGFIAANPRLSPEQKKKLLNVATVASGALASPNIIEEMIASGRAVYHSPTKLRTAAAMVPGFLSHTMNDFTAPATYTLAKSLVSEE